MVGDTIGDFIIRLKNAGVVGKTEVVVPFSKLRYAIARKLVEKGYIEKVEENNKKAFKSLVVTLKYQNGKHCISGVKRVSKPGRRLYTGVSSIHKVKFGQGHMILSTPAGILTNDEAREKHVGGEQLFIVW